MNDRASKNKLLISLAPKFKANEFKKLRAD